jgi:AcrR family transcriptional regulator
MASSKISPKSGKAEATQARIFEAARRRFARNSFETVGMRDIAADAGVDLALVGRYFGSKLALFVACLDGAFGIDDLLTVPLSEFGPHLARLTLAGTDASGDFDAVGLLLNAATSPVTAELVSQRFHQDFVEPLAGELPGRDRVLRATLLASYVVGLAAMRHNLGSARLVGRDGARAATMAGEAMQDLIDGSK